MTVGRLTGLFLSRPGPGSAARLGRGEPPAGLGRSGPDRDDREPGGGKLEVAGRRPCRAAAGTTSETVTHGGPVMPRSDDSGSSGPRARGLHGQGLTRNGPGQGPGDHHGMPVRRRVASRPMMRVVKPCQGFHCFHRKVKSLLRAVARSCRARAIAQARRTMTVIPLKRSRRIARAPAPHPPAPVRRRRERPAGTKRCHRPAGPCDAASRSVSTSSAPSADDTA